MTGEWRLFTAEQLPGRWWETWDQLNDQHTSSHPLLASSMVRTLVRHFPGPQMRFAEWSDSAGSQVQTIVHSVGRGRWTLFSPSQAPIAPLVFARSLSDEGKRVLRDLLTCLPRALVLRIPYQDPHHSLVPMATSAAFMHVSLGVTMAVEAPDGFDAYWNARSRDLRQNMRRYMKRVEREGFMPAIRAVVDSGSIGDAVDRFGELESLGWKGRKGTALHPGNVQGRFYRDLFAELAGCDRATALELWFGERLAASRLLISGPTMHVMLKTTFAEDLKQFAPGRILLYLSLQHLFTADQTRRVEFYTRANADMLAWASESREMYSSSCYRFRLLAALAKRRADTPAVEANSAD